MSILRSRLIMLVASALLAACQPAPAPAPPAPALASITLGIQANGIFTLNGEVVSKEELSRRLEAAAAQTPQPEIHIEPDAAAAFRDVAHVMTVAQRLGLTKRGVIGGT